MIILAGIRTAGRARQSCIGTERIARIEGQFAGCHVCCFLISLALIVVARLP